MTPESSPSYTPLIGSGGEYARWGASQSWVREGYGKISITPRGVKNANPIRSSERLDLWMERSSLDQGVCINPIRSSQPLDQWPSSLMGFEGFFFIFYFVF